MNKSEIITNSIFMLISLGGLYFMYGNKYIHLSSFITLGISYGMAKGIIREFQKDNAGGTTPYNPLKIPAKKTIPANII